MPFVIPTVAMFRAKFPTFPSVEDDRLEQAFDDAASEIDANVWSEGDYQPGVLYLAAHLLIVDGVIAAGEAEVSSPEITDKIASAQSIKVGDTQITFSSGGSAGITASSSGGASNTSATVYGQRYEVLRRRNVPSTHFFLRA